MTQEKNKVNDKDFVLFKKVGLIDKYNFYEYIAVMIDGGISLTEALESVHTKIKSPYFRQKIRELIAFVSSGDSFSRSMRKAPDVFDISEVSIIESGETIGQLSNSLMKISGDLKKVHELKNKIKGALTYPIIIFLFLGLALTIVMTYVVPAIKPLFEDSGVELPYATQLLIGVSNFMVNNFALLVLVIITIIGGFVLYFNTTSGKIVGEKLVLSFPLVGKVYKNYVLAKLASTLGNLVGSGVSIIKSLQLTGKSTGSVVYEDILDTVAEKVGGGQGIIASMEEIDKEEIYFPADYLQMLSVGEKTAALEEVSKKLSTQYEKEVDYSLANMTKWIEPIAILIAGVFVMWFAFAIFGAIMQVTQTVG